MSSEDFKSLILTDPDLIDEGIDVSGLRTQTDTNQRLLGAIEDYPGISYDPTSYSYLSDLNRLFASGLPTIDTSQPATPAPPSGGGGGGGGGGTSPGTGGGGTTPGTNTPEEQRLIDEGIGLQIGPGQPVFAPGEMPVTQEEIDAFNQIPVNTDYRNQQLVNQGIGLRVGDRGPVFAPGEAPVTQAEINAFNQTPQDYSVTGALGVDPREKQDFVTQEDVDNPKGFLAKLGISPDFDIKKALLEAGINYAVGIPISLIGKILGSVLPEMDPRQKALREFYNIDDIGRVAEGELMAGYNPVSGGGLYTLTGGRAGEEPTYGLQEAYDDRINTIENTLANKYSMTAADIADVKAGSYTGDVDSDLLDRLNQLEEAKEKEKGRLDLFSGDINPEGTGDASIAERIAEADRLGISGDIGVEGEDEGRFTTPTTTFTGVNPFEDTDTGIGEFYTDPVTGVTRPGTELDPYNPNQRTSIIEQAQQLGVGNVEQHLDNNSKLARARDEGLISPEDYNILGGYDVTQNITAGSTFAGGALNMFGSPVYNIGQAITNPETQKLGDIPGTVARNTVGGYGLLSQDQKNAYDAIVNADDASLYTDEGIAAVKNQIEMSQYRDPIMDMVQPDVGTLADDTINRMTDDVDLDDFDTTPPAPPSPPTGTDRPGGDRRDDGPAPSAPQKATETASYSNEDSYESAAYDRPAPSQPAYQGGTTQRPGSGGGGGGGGGGCFLADTLITMADGSTKEVQKVDLGDNVAEGGKVFATGKFLVENLHDYKGIKVSGSHMVNEDSKWVRVEDSKHGKPLGDDEHTVYVFGSENRRILINGILFTDYFETTEQEKLINDEKDFFNNWKTYENKIDQDNINILNAS